MEQPILVVDDEDGIRSVLTRALEDEGFPVETASNGEEALARIQAQRPRMVLLDLRMPVMTGWQLLLALQQAQIDVPIVLMTADYRARTEAVYYGVAGCLIKPFDLADFFEVVKHCSSSS